MLSQAMRLTRPAEFSAVLKAGRRVGGPHFALHLLPAYSNAERSARVGFVVSSKVGNSVVRHRVTRRLREQVRPFLGVLPAGTDIVIRAFPAAATATSVQLSADLQRAFTKLRAL